MIDNSILPLLSTKETAKILGIPIATLHKYTFEKKISYLKIGRHCKFKYSDIQAFMDKNFHPAED